MDNVNLPNSMLENKKPSNDTIYFFFSQFERNILCVGTLVKCRTKIKLQH